jgi:hypothetical protein
LLAVTLRFTKQSLSLRHTSIYPSLSFAAPLSLARIVPGYGPKMVGIVGGMYHVLLWRFIWTAAVPNAIGALLFAFGGHGLKHYYEEMRLTQ